MPELNTYKLLKTLFKNNQRFFLKSEFENFSVLISSNITTENKDNLDVLDLCYSTEFYSSLLKYIELESKYPFTNNITESFRLVDVFINKIRNEKGSKILNEFDDVFNGLKIWLLQKFKDENTDNPKDFLITLENLDSRERHLYNYERIFFKYLPVSNYSIDEIAEIIIHIWSKGTSESTIIDFLRGYGKANHEQANLLLTALQKQNCHLRICSHLLIGLYNAQDKNALDLTINLKEQDYIETLIILGRINYSNVNDLEKAFKVFKPLNFANKEIANEQSYSLIHLINNVNINKDLEAKCFNLLIELIENGTSEIVDSVFHSIIYYLNDHEQEKYELLHKYLSKTRNISVIKHFFLNFKDPIYLFDLIQLNFAGNPNYRFPIQIFQEGLNHAEQNNPEKFELLVLELFKHPIYSILAVKIILSQHHGIYKVDLLKLEDADSQINAINSFCKSPIYFDKLLPLLLELRNSRFTEIREQLQNKLAAKIFYSYHEIIHNQIKENLTDSIEDMDFLTPLTKVLEDYFELKKLKESIKDIDPIENEKDLMNLYYRLEREQQAKMMNQINKGENSFLQLIKSTIIVRGNSFKIGDREVSPLGHIESKILIDSEAFLNPDLFDYNLNRI